MNLARNSGFCGELYRYGHQGQEKDDEVKDKGNSYDFGARMYDSRLGRWLSVDRLVSYYSSYSSYSYSLNNPVYFIDVDGKYVIPTDEKSKEMIVGLIERQVGSGEVAKLLTSHLGLYTDNYKISKKEFKKAIKADLVNGIETDGKGGIYNGGKDAQLARDQITNSDSRIPASIIKDNNSVNVSFRPSENMGNLSLDLIYFDDQGYQTHFIQEMTEETLITKRVHLT